MTDAHHKPIPPGFKPVKLGGPYMATIGPFYLAEDETNVRLGMYIERQHCNPLAIVHGGLLSSFADMSMPVLFYKHPVVVASGRVAPTVSLQVDFLGAARMGDWIESEAEVLKVTRSLIFAQSKVFANGQLILRASGVYKLGPVFSVERGMYTDEIIPEMIHHGHR